jgi:hypothetical protein
MARQNNSARSLIIMSKLQGWDPTKIEGSSVDLGYKEDIPTQGTKGWMAPEGGPPQPADQSMPPQHAESNQAGHGGTGNPGTGLLRGGSPGLGNEGQIIK